MNENEHMMLKNALNYSEKFKLAEANLYIV